MINQLQTLVKRGLTPGLGLTVGSKLSGSDTRDSDLTLPAQRGNGKKPMAVCNRGFITKAGIAASIVGNDCETSNHEKHDSLVKEKENELDDTLRRAARQPDGERRVEDIERQYLGRWNGVTEAGR